MLFANVFVRVFLVNPVLKTLTLFQTKIYDFPYPISDRTIKIHTLFQTLWCVANSATFNRFTAHGTSSRRKRCSFLCFFVINVHGNTRYSKNGIPDQIDGIYTLFQTKMAKSIPNFRLEMLENGTLWGGTYPYGLYMGVPPPPPPGPNHGARLGMNSQWLKVSFSDGDWNSSLSSSAAAREVDALSDIMWRGLDLRPAKRRKACRKVFFWQVRNYFQVDSSGDGTCEKTDVSPGFTTARTYV